MRPRPLLYNQARFLWAAAAILAATVPALAMFCLGRSPSRYESDNLPEWELRAPSPAGLRIKPACEPQPATFREATVPVLFSLVSANEATLFSTLESPPDASIEDGDALTTPYKVATARPALERAASSDAHRPVPAGAPGLWLEEAAALGGLDPSLKIKMDRVAARLMDDQAHNGYIGPAEPAGLYSAADIESHADNLRGLLAYSHVCRQPAVIYAAMCAGDFLLDTYSPWPGHQEPEAEDSVVYALSRLYIDCGQPAYLRFARREEADRGCLSLGHCGLYEATGDPTFLGAARQDWWTGYCAHTIGNDMEHASADLYRITGCTLYLKGMDGTLPASIWPLTVAYTRQSDVIRINGLYDSDMIDDGVHIHTIVYHSETSSKQRDDNPEASTAAMISATAIPRGDSHWDQSAQVHRVHYASGGLSAVRSLSIESIQPMDRGELPFRIVLEPNCVSAVPGAPEVITVNNLHISLGDRSPHTVPIQPLRLTTPEAMAAQPLKHPSTPAITPTHTQRQPHLV